MVVLKAVRTQCTPVNTLYFTLKNHDNMMIFYFIRWLLFFPNYIPRLINFTCGHPAGCGYSFFVLPN